MRATRETAQRGHGRLSEIGRIPNAIPAKAGLYDPAEERDACGLASIVSLTGAPSHDIVRLALEALENLEHRGAVGSDAGTGDGAGILCEIPDQFLREE